MPKAQEEALRRVANKYMKQRKLRRKPGQSAKYGTMNRMKGNKRA